MKIMDLLTSALKNGASDIHLSVGTAPALRINGKLTKAVINGYIHPPLTPDDTLSAAKIIMTSEQYQNWLQRGEIDFSYSIPGVGRFRVNAYRQRGCASLAIRTVPHQVPTLESLKFPMSVTGLTDKTHGLVLVTGPAGSGKSTTLAALIDKINRERSVHVITIEDPIEYLHQHQKSMVDQRELGIDTFSMGSALRASLRQDPDVILISELRDLETISIAITAAETGHLVFGALYTGGAVQTIDRLIEIFPPGQQEQIKIQLSTTLQGIISQQILARADGNGRVMAAEILQTTPAVRNLIREGKTHQLITVMQTGSRWGMQTMDMALRDLVRAGEITVESALRLVADQDGFIKSVQ